MSLVQANNIQPASGQALTIKDEGGTASITVATNGEATFAENIIIGTGGKGIDFSAQTTSSASGTTPDTSSGAELFDHYEKGEWTPSLSCGTSGTLTINTTYDNGEYIKIGDLVWINCHIRVSATSSPSGELRVSGLPFARRSGSGGLDRSVFIIWGHNMGTASGASLQGYLSGSSTVIRIQEFLNGSLDTSVTNGMGTSSEFNVTGCYIAG